MIRELELAVLIEYRIGLLPQGHAAGFIS